MCNCECKTVPELEIHLNEENFHMDAAFKEWLDAKLLIINANIKATVRDELTRLLREI